MTEQTIGGTALGPSGKLQGGVKFFSLMSGKVVHRQKNDYKILPILEDTITRMRIEWLEEQDQDYFFVDRQNVEDDDEQDEDYNPEEDGQDSDNDNPEDMVENQFGENDIDEEDAESEIKIVFEEQDPIKTEDDIEVIEITGVHPEDQPVVKTGANDDKSKSNEPGVTTRSGRITRSTQDGNYVYVTATPQ